VAFCDGAKNILRISAITKERRGSSSCKQWELFVISHLLHTYQSEKQTISNPNINDKEPIAALKTQKETNKNVK